MGLFDKKYCDICGEKIGMLGNRKLDDGNCCKDCAKKLSPWFSERRHSTIEAIKEQLQDREDNKALVNSFQVTRQFDGAYKKIFIDETKGQFAVGCRMDTEENPDVLELNRVSGCVLDVHEHRTEERYKDNEGNMKNYNPPRYKYSYSYDIKITVNSKWFDEINVDLTGSNIDGNNQIGNMEKQNLGNSIIAALTGRQPQGCDPYGQQPMPGNNMYGQQPMPGNNMYGQQPMPGNNMYGQQPMPGSNMYGQQPMPGSDMYGQQPMPGSNMYGQQSMPGSNMYGQQPMPGSNMYGQQPMSGNNMYGQQPQMQRRIRCDKCGWETMDLSNVPKFCPMCGDPIDFSDVI